MIRNVKNTLINKKLAEVIQYLDQNQEVSRIYIGGLAELNGQPSPFVISMRLQA